MFFKKNGEELAQFSLDYLFKNTDQFQALVDKSNKSYLKLVQIIDKLVDHQNPLTVIQEYKTD